MRSDVPPDRLLEQGVTAIMVLDDEDRLDGLVGDIVQECITIGAVYEDEDGDRIFCYIFEDYPEEIVEASEQSFKADLGRWFHFEDLFPLEGLRLSEREPSDSLN